MNQPPKEVRDQAPEGTVWFGGPVDETRLSLRVFGESLDPETITSLLGHSPTTAEKKGHKRISKSGHESIAKRGSWRLEAPRSDEGSLESQIEWILSRLTDDLDLWKRVTEAYKVDLFCGLFLKSINRGLTLSPETLFAIGQRGIQIGFDIYCEEETSDETIDRSDA